MRKWMRVPDKFLIHERWIACTYTQTHPWMHDGWTLRHACGKYSKMDLERYKKYEKEEPRTSARWSPDNMGNGWTGHDIKGVSKIPVMFGNKMRRGVRRSPKGVCPRCGEKVPGGLALWVTTMNMRGDK